MQNFMSQRQQSELGGRLQSNRGISSRLRQLDASSRSVVESWPIPSLCVGAKAGVLPDAGISPEGINVKIPYLALDLPFPSLTLSVGGDKAKLELKPGSAEKTSHKAKKD